MYYKLCQVINTATKNDDIIAYLDQFGFCDAFAGSGFDFRSTWNLTYLSEWT